MNKEILINYFKKLPSNEVEHKRQVLNSTNRFIIDVDDILQNRVEMEKFLLEGEEYEKLEYLKKRNKNEA